MTEKLIAKARLTLEKERNPASKLYAGLTPYDAEDTPMMVEGLLRDRGVSVFFGDFDEFKTTLVLDIVAHIAAGTDWQGRPVRERAVVWYALEGADEIPGRVQALEAEIGKKKPRWGDDHLPITVRDRIPNDYRRWRAEIGQINERWSEVYSARTWTDELPKKGHNALYSGPDTTDNPPLIIIDTLSLALGGEDEKGPAATQLILNCLDLLKERPDFECPDLEDERAMEKWREAYPDETVWMSFPAASHVIIIHHQTKTGTDFAGHRAIGANTQGLFRVHRFGKMADAERPYAGQLTPLRVKGIPRPAPIRFEVQILPVGETKQTAAILKGKARAIPKPLTPIIEAFRKLVDADELSRRNVNECIDKVAKNRTTRNRYRAELEKSGVLEPVEDDDGKFAFYRFHDLA